MTTNQRMNDLLRRAAGRIIEAPQPMTGYGSADGGAGRNQQPYRVQSANEAMNEAIRAGGFRILEEKP